jgi:hypothetical protein
LVVNFKNCSKNLIPSNQFSCILFQRDQDEELQDRAARGQTYGATGGVLQAEGPPSGETSYKAPYIPGMHLFHLRLFVYYASNIIKGGI